MVRVLQHYWDMTAAETPAPMTLSLAGATIEVVPCRGGGYAVSASWCPGCDEMWERIDHAAVFAHRFDAERLADRVRTTRMIDLSHWLWEVSRCSPYSFRQAPPTAKRDASPRPPSVWAAAREAALD